MVNTSINDMAGDILSVDVLADLSFDLSLVFSELTGSVILIRF